MRRIALVATAVTILAHLIEPIKILVAHENIEESCLAISFLAIGLLSLLVPLIAFKRMDNMHDLLEGMEKLLSWYRLFPNDRQKTTLQKSVITMKRISEMLTLLRMILPCILVLAALHSYIDGTLAFR